MENDAGVGNSSLCPGDLLMARWPDGRPRMVDVVVAHPLAPSLGLSVTGALAAASSKESRKQAKYAELISGHNLEFTPWHCPLLPSYNRELTFGRRCASTRPNTTSRARRPKASRDSVEECGAAPPGGWHGDSGRPLLLGPYPPGCGPPVRSAIKSHKET